VTLQAIFFDLGDTLVSSGTRTWRPGAKALLASLGSQGFRLGIISNTTGLTSRTDILALLPADFDIAAFDSTLVLFSSEVGVTKPDKAIFDKAVAAAGVAASECLYCSENLVETLAAQRSGMRAVRVQPPPGSDLAVLEAAILAYLSLP
jgi:FMN phosphatase YigB (HAD superfamily)